MRNILKISTLIFVLICLTSCFSNFGLTKSITVKEWNIDEYKIKYSRKLGPAGGPFYQYDVYKKKRYLSYNASIVDTDSCLLRFREKDDYFVDFNLCQQTKKILRPDKEKFYLKSIDSITIRPYENFDPTHTKRLSDKEIKIFVKKWNNSKAIGINRLTRKSYDFLLTVYIGKSTRTIKTLNYFLTENQNWSYESTEDKFFNKLWNEKR